MKKKITGILIIILILIIVAFGYYLLFQTETEQQPQESQAITTFIPDSNYTLTIMNWNIQTFGKAKWEKPETKEKILNIIPKADIIFIQEIRDKSGEAFQDLCNQLNQTHKCNISSRAGRSSSKEQYGIIYKKDINIVNIKDYNPDPDDRWERPPVSIIFNSSGYVLIAYNIHTKPTNASIEIQNLENTINNQGNTIILGDLNADCKYYNPEQEKDFLEWEWIIKDDDDTTVSGTNCAYDRIIINKDMYEEYIRYGIFMNITKEVSDHYPVWVEIDEKL